MDLGKCVFSFSIEFHKIKKKKKKTGYSHGFCLLLTIRCQIFIHRFSQCTINVFPLWLSATLNNESINRQLKQQTGKITKSFCCKWYFKTLKLRFVMWIFEKCAINKDFSSYYNGDWGKTGGKRQIQIHLAVCAFYL